MRRWRAVRSPVWLGVPATDLVLGVGLTIGALVAVGLRPVAEHPWAELAATGMVGPLVVRTRAPLAMAVTSAAAVCLLAALPHPTTSLWQFAGVLLLAFSVGAHLSGARAGAGLGALLLSAWVLQFASGPDLVERVLTPPILIGAPALAGWLLQHSRTQEAALRRLTAELAEEKELHAAAAAVAERTRIARELHDVIAHSVSVMVVQAGAAEQLMTDRDAALPHVRAVRSAGREALAELRRSLGLLRGGPGAHAAPQPTLADLPALVSAGGAQLTTTGDVPADAAPGLHLAAYRIVQEALTNARRHAPGAAVRVLAEYRPDQVLLTVDDDGGPPRPVREGTGHGLPGMAERAALYDGVASAGPRPDGGGWRVTAELPLRTPAPDREVAAR
jgi:signal transduction histidine kinase